MFNSRRIKNAIVQLTKRDGLGSKNIEKCAANDIFEALEELPIKDYHLEMHGMATTIYRFILGDFKFQIIYLGSTKLCSIKTLERCSEFTRKVNFVQEEEGFLGAMEGIPVVEEFVPFEEEVVEEIVEEVIEEVVEYCDWDSGYNCCDDNYDCW